MFIAYWGHVLCMCVQNMLTSFDRRICFAFTNHQKSSQIWCMQGVAKTFYITFFLTSLIRVTGSGDSNTNSTLITKIIFVTGH